MDKVIEVADPARIDRVPDKTIVLMSEGKFLERGHLVKNIALNLYVQKKRRDSWTLLSNHSAC